MSRKILLTIMLLAFVKVSAQEAKKEDTFKFSGQAYVYTATYNHIIKDRSMSFSAYRFRPYFSYKTENVEATLKLELDQYLGSKVNETDDSKYVKIGADTKNVLEVKAAYVMFNNIFTEGLYAKGGVDDYKTPGGFIVGTDVGFGTLGYKWDKNNISAVFIKVDEGKPDLKKDDTQLYGIDATITLPILTIRPAFYMIQGGKGITDKPWSDNTAILPAISITSKIENIDMGVSFTYGSGENKISNKKYSGYAVDANINYLINKDIKIGVFFTNLSGDKASTTDKKEGFASFQLKHDGFGRMFLIENQQTFSNIAPDTFADIRGKEQGYMLVGITSNVKFDIISIKLNAGFAQLMQKVSDIKPKKDLGIEIDLSTSIEVAKNANIVLEGAYLATGKGFGPDGLNMTSGKDVQSAIYLASGLLVKF